ncbi:ankyrin repeat protein [Colletotrichum tofieldiae]|nr:ankyrin repeat protein [Colletotrichum tofieldiae]
MVIMLLDAGIVVPRLFNTIQFLNEKSAEIEAKDKYGGTALSFAYPGGGIDGAVRLLIYERADFDLIEQWCRTALPMARRHKRDEATEMLVEVGAQLSDCCPNALEAAYDSTQFGQ